MKINEELLKSIAKKGSALVLAGSLLLGGNQIVLNDKNNNITTVYAASQNDSEVVNLDVQMGINLYLNDKGFIPTDVNGKQTYPFISDGTTYVPIRAIAQLFNANISWDEKTNTVKITTSGQEAKLEHTILEKQNLYNVNITAEKGAKLIINGKECIPKDVNGNVKDIYIVNGTTYVPVRAVSEALGLPITWSDLTNSVFIGKHKDYGLTVENVNDPKVFDECGRDFFYSPADALDLRYKFDGQIYLLNSEKKDADYFACSFGLVFANYEYCSKQMIASVFDGIDEYTVERFIDFFDYYAIIMGPDYAFRWEKHIINKEQGIMMEQMQTKYANAQETGNYDEIIDAIIDYFEGNDSFRFQNTTPFIDYVISIICMNVRYESGTDRYDSNYVYYHIVDAREELTKQVDEVKELLLRKKLTK